MAPSTTCRSLGQAQFPFPSSSLSLQYVHSSFCLLLFAEHVETTAFCGELDGAVVHCVQPEDSAGMLCVQHLGVGLYARRKRMDMLMGNPYAQNVGH